MKKWILFTSIAFTLAFITACGADEDENVSGEDVLDGYPDDDITIIWSSSPGSGGDIFLRSLAEPLEELLDVSVVVENREGASGANAWNHILNNTDPDGYTLLGTSATFISSPVMNDLDISHEDFKPVAQMFTEPQFLYTYADSEFDDAEELINHELENPEELQWATATPGSKDNISISMILEETGIDPHTVSFDSGTDALTQIVGEHIDVALGEYSALQGQIDSGTVKVLGALTEERYEHLPDVPTLTELGWDVAPILSRGLVVHGDTPDEIVDYLAEVLEDTYEDEGFQEVYEQQGLQPDYAPRDEFRSNLEEMDDFVRSLLD
ncbi:tripartite tricarboxylate transporter substrate binding protein [Alkalibacillus silvisoli]|uniref:Tripartite tricarboxylate transporter substrate binding protein n=1 Tax=Alkalibacillus silvisoli TaxID=392823 RepID=A0ABP3K575_9BACI